MIADEENINYYSCKNYKMSSFRLMRITSLLPLILLAGCVLFSPDRLVNEETENDASAPVDATLAKDELIATDLMNALMQIDGYHPQNTVVRLSGVQNGFGAALQTVLQSAGYALRVVDTTGGENYLDYLVIAGPVEKNGSHFTYLVSVGNVKLKRQYFLQEQGVSPSSNLYIQGADPGAIVLHDDLFSQPRPVRVAPNNTPEQSESATDAESANIAAFPIASAPVTLTAAPRGEAILISDAVTTTPESISPTPKMELARLQTKQNMYELGQSNYTAVLKDYHDVRQHTLIFGNDSLRLGLENRLMLRELVKVFSDRTDLLSVIGCSHGRTSLQNGNAVLATGRANRVKEALIHAGVPAERILEEGCWSSEYFDEVMPRRGVVLTLKREIKSS